MPHDIEDVYWRINEMSNEMSSSLDEIIILLNRIVVALEKNQQSSSSKGNV